MPGNDFYWFVLGSLKCLTETIYGVVIGQSESRKIDFPWHVLPAALVSVFRLKR